MREVVRFGTTSMVSTKYMVLEPPFEDAGPSASAPAPSLPGFYTAGDLALLRRGVQFHEYEFEQVGYEVYGRLHTYGR